MRHLVATGTHAHGRGFTLFELAVSITIITVLVGVLLQRMQLVQQQAEIVKVEQTIGILRSALALKTARMQAGQERDNIAGMANMNPMLLLQSPPQNYLGELFAPEPKDLNPGNWYFDKKEKMLVYLLNDRKSFPTGTANSLKYKVKFFYSPQNIAETQVGSEAISISIAQVND